MVDIIGPLYIRTKLKYTFHAKFYRIEYIESLYFNILYETHVLIIFYNCFIVKLL